MKTIEARTGARKRNPGCMGGRGVVLFLEEKMRGGWLEALTAKIRYYLIIYYKRVGLGFYNSSFILLLYFI